MNNQQEVQTKQNVPKTSIDYLSSLVQSLKNMLPFKKMVDIKNIKNRMESTYQNIQIYQHIKVDN